jgi:hypothetical protein
VSNRLYLTIAWWELACGASGIAMFAALYLEVFPNSRAVLNVMGPINYWGGIVFFSLVIAAGKALLKPSSSWGLKASALCQAVQVVSFAFLNGPYVQIRAGPRVGIHVSSTFVGLDIGFSSSFFIGTRIAGPVFQITVNVLAAVWSVLLVREWLRMRHVASTAAGLTGA